MAGEGKSEARVRGRPWVDLWRAVPCAKVEAVLHGLPRIKLPHPSSEREEQPGSPAQPERGGGQGRAEWAVAVTHAQCTPRIS